MENTADMKARVMAEHDAACITNALTAAVDSFIETLMPAFETVLLVALGFIDDGTTNCRCTFMAMSPERRQDYMKQFSDDALAAMASGGYWNDSTGERLTVTLEELNEFYARKTEDEIEWSATEAANYVAGDPESWNAVVASDTVVSPRYSLQVNGEFLKGDSMTATASRYVTSWGIAYVVSRVLKEDGLWPLDNVHMVQAVYDSRFTGEPVELVLNGTPITFTVVTEDN